MDELFSKVSKDLELVKDGDINYLVMNAKDNKANLEWMEKFNDILDQVEKSKGPGVLVTIGTS